MKYFFSIIFFVFFYFTSIQAQISITADSLKKLQTGKKMNIFLTATWCSPCMTKLKDEDEKLNKDSSDLNILIFDRLGFSNKVLKNLRLKHFDSSNTFFIPYTYYKSKGFIQINSSNKSIKNFFKDIMLQYPKSEPVKSFWIDSAITITKENKLFLRKEKTPNP